MTKLLLAAGLFVLAGGTALHAQWQMSTLTEAGVLRVSPQPAPPFATPRGGPPTEQLSGFPRGFPANPSFKNIRNLTLADLDGDGSHEILAGIDGTLYAFRADTLLWEKALAGTAIYPPSVADLDRDGAPEIVLNTGGVPSNGRVYALAADGTDLPGWPLDLDQHWMLVAPTLADLDGNDTLEIICLERVPPGGRVHVRRLDGSTFSEGWPVTLAATPAVTPSVGDVDNDGEPEIVVYSTEARYILRRDGSAEAGFPLLTHPERRYSYQSPLLVDLDGDQDLEIIGATHGSAEAAQPEFYVMEHDGGDAPGWPIPVPDQRWTFNTPTVITVDGESLIFMSRPIGTEPADMLYGWDAAGNPLPGFPIVKSGGLEGIISVADVDGDTEMELVFGSNLLDDTGHSYLHAYELDGSGEVPGFPIRLYGWNFLNGAAFGDVNGDGLLDLAALSYTQTFGAGIDSAFINVIELNVPYTPERVAWGTYKGDNSRRGGPPPAATTAVTDGPTSDYRAILAPNPAGEIARLQVTLPRAAGVRAAVFDAHGRTLRRVDYGPRPAGAHQLDLNVATLPAGVYFVRLEIAGETQWLPLVKSGG